MLELSKREKVALMEGYIKFLDLTKTRVRKFSGLRTGKSLIAAGITQVAFVKVDPKITYKGHFEVNEVPKHRDNIMDIINSCNNIAEVEDKLAAYLVIWGDASKFKAAISSMKSE